MRKFFYFKKFFLLFYFFIIILNQTEAQFFIIDKVKKCKVPLAGESYDTVIAGEKIHIPARDRRIVKAFNIGMSIFSPSIGNNYIVPFAAFYYRQHWYEDTRRIRAIISGFVNYIDFADGTWNPKGIEFLLHWKNFTLPFPRAEIVAGNEVEYSKIYWGYILGGIGFGWRQSIYPYHCDNDIRIQLYYEPGFFYNKKSSKTGDDVELPPNTYIHQLHLLFRIDSFDRNLLELPHKGWAGGLDIVIGRRDRWSDHQFSPYIVFKEDDTRDYLKISGYITTAFDMPFLCEKHRFLTFFHFGYSPKHNLDRYSAFRIGGGPLPSESNDLSRHPFPGALFDQFLAGKFMIVTLEYRYEVLFFLYLHIRGTFAWGEIPTLNKEEHLIIENEFGEVFTIAITTGFFWNSMLYIEYSYDNGVTRLDKEGHSILITWSKSF